MHGVCIAGYTFIMYCGATVIHVVCIVGDTVIHVVCIVGDKVIHVVCIGR